MMWKKCVPADKVATPAKPRVYGGVEGEQDHSILFQQRSSHTLLVVFVHQHRVPDIEIPVETTISCILKRTYTSKRTQQLNAEGKQSWKITRSTASNNMEGGKEGGKGGRVVHGQKHISALHRLNHQQNVFFFIYSLMHNNLVGLYKNGAGKVNIVQ